MKVVVSGVNLIEGGPLKVFKDVVGAFLSKNIDVICLVHKVSLFESMSHDKLILIEYPSIKSSWLKRILFEYYYCKKISSKLKPDIWLSMHDMTPSLLDVTNQFVYCHNPSPFYSATLKDYRFSLKFTLFTLLYKFLYMINIKTNTGVIVQQGWIGEFFKNKMKAKKILIAKPVEPLGEIETVNFKCDGRLRLFYPALSRTFKNFELLLDSMSYLKINNVDAYEKIKLVLTIDDKIDAYSKFLVNKYSHLENVDFLGMLSREGVDDQYEKCDVVVFPSKLETWGLPISEAKDHNKPIILVDLPYAYETLGNYSAACFVNPDDYIAFSKLLTSMLSNKNVFNYVSFQDSPDVCFSWDSLVDSIIINSDCSIKNLG